MDQPAAVTSAKRRSAARPGALVTISLSAVAVTVTVPEPSLIIATSTLTST
jgi:hypothetical protein